MSTASGMTGATWLLPPLLLSAPFLSFLDHHGYGLTNMEAALALAGVLVVASLFSFLIIAGGAVLSSLVVVGLIVVFIDVQFNWIDGSARYAKATLILGLMGLSWIFGPNLKHIAAAVFATVFVITLLQLDFVAADGDVRFTGKMEASATQSRRLIHIVFDEHIGLDGIPTDMEEGDRLKTRIKRFYEKNEFRVFGGAFSRYVDTVNSITNTLNFSTSNRSRSFLLDEDSLQVGQNRYFEWLMARGYRVNVLETTYLGVCANDAIDNCLEYGWGLGALRSTPIPIWKKMLLMYASFADQSYIFRRIRNLYCVSRDRADCVGTNDIHKMEQGSFRKGIAVNTSIWGKPIEFHSLSTLELLDGLWQDIVNSPPGTALFAHLLFPHGPFVAHPDCSIKRPVEGWKDRSVRGSEASRREHYRHYFEQLECLYSRLDELIDRMRHAGIYDDSIVVFQGDHGSRIYVTEPTPKNLNRLTKQDFSDAYSTLFAVKAPGAAPGYDTAARPLQELLAEFVSGCFEASAACPPDDSSEVVYLYEESENNPGPAELLAVPYLPAARQAE